MPPLHCNSVLGLEQPDNEKAGVGEGIDVDLVSAEFSLKKRLG